MHRTIIFLHRRIMKRRLLTLAFIASLLVACNSRPDKVLSDDDMEDLLVDIYKSEAIIELNSSDYNNDSMKAVVKQSVFLKHGVTQEQYDSSLVWYGHNVNKYVKIYENVIARLDDEEIDIKKTDKSASVAVKSKKRAYPASGDSADVWESERVWIFMPQYGTNVLRFDTKSKPDDRNGDRYKLVVRVRNAMNQVGAFIGADYYDGSTSYAYRTSLMDGENTLILQGDSTKRVRRVYGYLTAKPSPGEVVLVDSIMLLRTRLDRNQYSSFIYQKWAGLKSMNPDVVRKRKLEEERRKAESEVAAKKQDEVAESAGAGNRSIRYKPKPGLNKSSHQSAND